jgi:prepilin-type N-terminal cleavage/methylation domain-containing protein
VKRPVFNRRGFTLVELLLAMTFFSLILMFVTASFLQVSQAYNKGITVKRIHESGRAVLAEMSRALVQGSTVAGGVQAPGGCLIVAGTRYVWNSGFHGSGSHGHRLMQPGNRDFSLIRDTRPTCGEAISSSEAVNLLDDKIIVQNISVVPVGSVTNTYRLTVSLSSDRSGGSGGACDAINDTYCDTVNLSTVVSIRN